MILRSNRLEVRNPVLALPAAQRLMAMSPEVRHELAALFGEICFHARTEAQKCWRKNKGPMALYWKVVGVYAYHLRRVFRITPSSAAFRKAA